MNAKPALVRPRFASDLDPQVALWITRLGNGFLPALSILNDGRYSEEIRQILGIAPQEGVFSKASLRPILKSRAIELEQKLPRRKSVLTRNLELLGELLELDRLQLEILSFIALSRHHPYLNELVESIRMSSFDAITKILSIALKAREVDLSTALRPDGQLRAARIVCVEQSEVGRGLRLTIPSGLRNAIFSDADNIQMLMRSFLEKAAEPTLDADAFAHIRAETDLLTAYLSKASARGIPGINVLIYGPPGTGKTEYVRWLASHLGKPLFQVRDVDDEGTAISGLDRLASFQLSQRFLQKSDALMLFDEIEDVFPSSDGFFVSRKPDAGKMFINRLLESNPVPAIWISNEISHMDKAYLRRFDFSFEMDIPPITARRRILRNHLAGFEIPEEMINELAQQEQLTAAQIEKAAKVVNLSATKPDDREATLALVIKNSQSLLRQKTNEVPQTLSECAYELDYLNPDCDLERLVAQLRDAPQSVGALCFYGAPGTGKTALAHYIAREIEVPIMIRRASDILSSYVGETERKIAAMFKTARQDGALLLLDEADSFLSERQTARTSWEVSAVNEMLTQMESFNGLFICSTNLMSRLDAASLRRFALKIKFDYLQPEQRWRMFLAQINESSRDNETECRAALNQLNNLTPGDFATIRRQAALLNVSLTADELLTRLTKECESKRCDQKQQIGFVRTN